MVSGTGRAIVGPRATTIFSLGGMRAGSLEGPVVEATLACERNRVPDGGKWTGYVEGTCAGRSS